MRKAILILLGGCGYKVWSPPARLLPLESSGTLGKNRTSVGAELSDHGGGGVDDIPGGTIRVQHNFAERLDGQAEAYYASVQGDSAAKTNGGIGALRAGVKWDAWRRDLAIVGGLGAGGSAGGGFLGADLGAIVAYENCVIVPFIGAHFLLSQPVGAKQVDVTKTGDATQHVDTPGTTFGFSIRAGLKLPMGRDICAENEKVDLFAGVELTNLSKSGAHAGFPGGGIGVQLNF
jgi:hypothetical protein